MHIFLLAAVPELLMGAIALYLLKRSRKCSLLVLLLAVPVVGQINVPAPQIGLSGNVGLIGSPILNSGTFQMPSDADVTFSSSNVNTSAFSIKITSAVSLTATRTIHYPAGRFRIDACNATTGGQSIVIIGPSGSGVTIANGVCQGVWNNGTDYVSIGSAGSVTASAMQSALAGQSGCTTSGNSWNPATNTCVAAGGGLPSGTGIVKVTSGSGGLASSGDFPTLNQSTTGNAATATALASTPTPCTSPQLAGGVDAHGNSINCATAGGTVGSSATINSSGSQVQADSTVYSLAGLTAFGDSITAAAGDWTGMGYVGYMAADYKLTPNNQGVPGDKVQDETWHIFTTLNPGDTGNPIVTSMIGTNNAASTAGYQAVHLAGHAWAAMSSSNKILLTSPAVALTGSHSTDTTWANAPGITCSSGSCTATYTAYAGSSGFIYLWYKEVASGASFSVTVDGSTATDTVTGLTSISTTWPTAPSVQTATVGLARYAAANTGAASTHTVVVTFQSGATILGFGFPPTKRYRGVTSPRVLIGGVPPQQNNGNPSQVAVVNGYNLADSKTLVADGLNAPFVDVYNGMDSVLDFLTPTIFQATFSGTTMTVTSIVSGPALGPGNLFGLVDGSAFASSITALGTGTGGTGTYIINDSHTSGAADGFAGVQGCVGSTNVGLHPDTCGHKHLAQMFESVINASPVPPTNPFIIGPLLVASPIAATGMGGFHQFPPHSYSDSLIAGFQQCAGIICGSKMYASPRGSFGFGLYVDSSKEVGIGFSTGSPTTESGFAWPIWFTPDGGIHGSYISSSGPLSSGLLTVGAPAATSAAGFHNITVGSYTDTLIGGINQCSGTFCGTKMFNTGGTLGWGAFVQSGSGKLACFGSVNTANPTAESNFTWPACWNPDTSTFTAPNLSATTVAATTVAAATGTIAYIDSGATQTTASCMSGGFVVGSEPFQGTSYKKVLLYSNACSGAFSFTIPVGFSIAPNSQGANAGLNSISTSTTNISANGTGASGFVIFEGY